MTEWMNVQLENKIYFIEMNVIHFVCVDSFQIFSERQQIACFSQATSTFSGNNKNETQK